MENVPVEPPAEETAEKKGGDAAAMSARIVALQGDSDEYSYKEPPPPAPKPAVSKSIRRRNLFLTVVGLILAFAAGGVIGQRLQKRKENPPIASVNGVKILSDDFAHACEIPAGQTVLKRLLDEKLLEQFARQKGVAPTQKDVEAKFAELATQPDFMKHIKDANETQDDFKHALFYALCRQAIVTEGIKVNPSEIRDYYDRNSNPKDPHAKFHHRENVVVQVIINSSQANIQNAAQELNAKTPFTQVVAKYDGDIPTRKTGGVLPALYKGSIDGRKFPGLEKVLFSLQAGQVSDPVQIGTNWWIIRCNSHTPDTVDPFDKVQEACENGLLYERGLKKSGVRLKDEETEFVKKAKIEIYDLQYNDLIPRR